MPLQRQERTSQMIARPPRFLTQATWSCARAMATASSSTRARWDRGTFRATAMPTHWESSSTATAARSSSIPACTLYHDRQWRNHFRSTRAHSTVEIDGVDQCVFWGPFRVAYPPDARLLEHSGDRATGEHLGYRRLRQAVTHRRTVARAPGGAWEIDDSLTGTGTHDFLTTFQLAPGALVSSGAGSVLARWAGEATLRVALANLPPDASISIESGWVSPGWYQKVEAPRIAIRWRATVPCRSRVSLEVVAG